MSVDVSAAGNGPHSFADGAAIFENGFVFGQIAQGDFVAERNVVAQPDAARASAFERDGADAGALFQISDGDADVILWFMQKNAVFHKLNGNERGLYATFGWMG